jgi:hypothetical protein
MAGVVALYSCSKDDDPADKGKKAAKELCDCYSKANDEQAKDACNDAIENKYKKYDGNKAFVDAYLVELAKCGSMGGDLAELGAQAAQEFCDCWADVPADDLGDMAKMFCAMPLMSKYAAVMMDETFGAVFTVGMLASCPDALGWLETFQSGMGQ